MGLADTGPLRHNDLRGRGGARADIAAWPPHPHSGQSDVYRRKLSIHSRSKHARRRRLHLPKAYQLTKYLVLEQNRRVPDAIRRDLRWRFAQNSNRRVADSLCLRLELEMVPSRSSRYRRQYHAQFAMLWAASVSLPSR